MNFKHVRIVFVKEIKDIMRDKRTLITTLLLPLLIMPIMFFAMGLGMSGMEESFSKNSSIGLTQNADTPAVRAFLQEMLKGMDDLVFVTDDVTKNLKEEKIMVILDVPQDADAILVAQKPLPIQVIFDESKTLSYSFARSVSDLITQNAEGIMRDRLALQGIVLEDLLPATTRSIDQKELMQSQGEPVPQQAGAGNGLLSMIVPMILAILLWSGSMAASTDMVAGEKERYTLEPLLATCANRMSILTGKFLAVMVFVVMSLASTILGLILAFAISPQFAQGFGGGSMSIYLPTSSALIIIATILSLGFTFIAVQIAISALARSMKQAQQWLSIAMLLVMVPAYATMFQQAGDIKLYMMFVPVLNTIASLKMVFGGIIHYDLLFVSLGTSIVYMLLALVWATRLFNREKVLFRT